MPLLAAAIAGGARKANKLRHVKSALVALIVVLGCSNHSFAQNQVTIWPSTTVPATADVGSDSSVELGMSFKSDTSGSIAGIRFYKSAGNTGAHVGNLWSGTGALLASATFTGETASGWQQVTFAKPVAITANTVYVASYHATIGHYSANWNYFATAGANNASLHALVSSSNTPNGRFAYGSSSNFPTASHQAANYWVDVVFVSGAAATLQVSTAQLPGGSVAGGYSSTLAATGGSTPYSWSVLSGSLPNGLTLSSGGVISGTPSLAGSFPFTIQVKDASSATASRNFSINVASPTPSVAISSPSSGSTVSGTVSVSGTASDSVSINSVQLSVDGGSYSLASGTNNWSFTLNTSSLSNGAHSLSAKTTDAAGISATSSPLALTVNNGSTSSNCTLFASPSGNDANSGTSSSAPKTFNGAAAASQPGSVVCLLAGTYNMSSTFYPPTSGSPSAWIVYQPSGNGTVNLVWTAGSTGQPMFKFGGGSFPSGAAYLEFKGFNLDGQNNALDGFLCQGGHHLSFIGNSINNTGGSGVGAMNCDYLTSDHNLINHNGYLYGWTSAISYNSAQWFDNYPGFHNIVSNNIITGEFDGSSNHTDGNGIILDLSSGSYNYSTANTPPALIINNVVYGNGGRCIQTNVVTNFWIVNNTCYKNDLDTSLGNVGSFTTQNSNNGYFINNIAVSAASNNPSYDQESSNSNIRYYADMYIGSSNNFSYSDPSQLINANPLFLNAPSLSIGGYINSLAPSLLGSDLTLLAISPAYNRGIDPSTLSGVPANIVSDLKKYIYTDINGKARPQGGGSDLGAYQH
jgi:Domain of unknown function (DUF4082)/Bacterial Ig domain/Putative Ig domain